MLRSDARTVRVANAVPIWQAVIPAKVMVARHEVVVVPLWTTCAAVRMPPRPASTLSHRPPGDAVTVAVGRADSITVVALDAVWTDRRPPQARARPRHRALQHKSMTSARSAPPTGGRVLGPR